MKIIIEKPSFEIGWKPVQDEIDMDDEEVTVIIKSKKLERTFHLWGVGAYLIARPSRNNFEEFDVEIKMHATKLLMGYD